MSAPGNEVEIDDDGAPPESGLRPAQAPRIRQDAPAPAEDDFEVVETDEQGNPLDPLAGTVLDRRQPEAPLTEEAAGQRPLIERQPEGDDQQRRPRERKADRNARRKESRDRVFNENTRLTQIVQDQADRLARLEGRMGETVEPRLVELGEARINDQRMRLDGGIATANQQYRAATARVSAAVQAQDADALTAAMEDRDNALILRTRLTNEKEAFDRAVATPAERRPADGDGRQRQTEARQPASPTQDPRLNAPQTAQFARAFSNEHDWYNPNDSQDIDSQTVSAIDNAVYQAGYDPRTPQYWAEVDARMREQLPWRFEDDGGQQQPARRQPNGQQQQRQQPAPIRRGPPTAGSSDRAAPGAGKRQVMISPERRQAMEAAGAIGPSGNILDANKYKRLLRSYDEFDRSNPSR